MIKTLRPVGNSLGLIIDRPILELLGIDRQTQLRVTTDGKVLFIEPVTEGDINEGKSLGKRTAAPDEKDFMPLGDDTRNR
jgi:antitoxin component of MazEF toxin-antitoxin module